MTDLATLHDCYLATRRHAIKSKTPIAQARYVVGEADELLDAVHVYAAAVASPRKAGEATAGLHVAAEIADVVLAAVTLAKMLGLTVEQCIDYKTALDRGRG